MVGPHAETGDEWIHTHLLHLEPEQAALLTTSAAEHCWLEAVRSSALMTVTHTLPAGGSGWMA